MHALRRAGRILVSTSLLLATTSVDAQQPITDSQQVERHGTDAHNPMPDPSPKALRPRVGAKFIEPPPVPPVPESLVQGMIGSDETALTLQTLEAMACSQNPTLTQAQAQIQGELGKAIQAGLIPNPTVRYVGEQWGLDGTAGEWQGAEFSQRIVTGRKLQLSRAKFLQLTRASQWRALEQEYQVLNDLRIHFWMALGRQELVQIHEDILKNAEDAVVTSRELYNVGQATRAAMHDANVLLQKSRLDLMMAQNNYRQSWWELISIAGTRMQPASLVGTLDGQVNPIEFDVALDRLLSESPQILAARAKLQADEIKVKRETVEPIPDLVVSYGYGRNFEAKENTHNTSLAIEVPLYDWNQGTIRQAESDVVRQQAEINRIELILQRDLARVYQAYLMAIQNVRSYQDVIVPESRMAYEVLLDAYKEDRVDWPQVLESQVKYYQMRAQYIDHLINWRTNETLIAGYLLHGGLMAPTGPQPPGHISAVPKPR